MKFTRASYKNYRCFMDVDLNFNSTNKNNIVLIVGPNGGGKTELLFSFWYVLYDFDFKSLKGKEDTPYSLNSSLYVDLMNSNEGASHTSTALIEFEHDDIVYRVSRSEKFTKKGTYVIKTQNVELSTIDEHGNLSLPETDPEIVRKRLMKIIPIKILYGIIFDGERMKQLSNNDDISKVAIEGVIAHITNEELFELCRNDYVELKEQSDDILKKVAKKNKKDTLEGIVGRLQKNEKVLNDQIQLLQTKKERQQDIDKELEKLSIQLKQNESSKIYEKQREDLKDKLKEKNKKYNECVEDFYKSLNDGYLLLSDQLFEDVHESLEKFDVPSGITVEAVKCIMCRKECICGCEMNDQIKKALETLMESLPPDNISSTINEMIRQTKMYVDVVRKTLRDSFKNITDLEKEISEIKLDIAHVSSQISENGTLQMKNVEKDYQSYILEKEKVKDKISDIRYNISFYEGLVKDLRKDRDNYTKDNYQMLFYQKKSDYLRKCIDVLDAIDEYNKKISLENINKKLNEAYSKLSEDYSRGRRIYIVQYNEKEKYRMVAYYENNYNMLRKKYEEDGTIASYRCMNKSEEEIHELVIMSVLESNSTGQSKVNTLAFAKAILDYSNEDREEESTEIMRNYPFLIDSPFTELSGENVTLSAGGMNTFANQIILMASEDSLKDVLKDIEPFVSKRYEFTKAKDKSYSTVEEVM